VFLEIHKLIAMKKILFTTIPMLLVVWGTAQDMASCCAVDATESFARLASDKKFVMSHDAPIPFHYESENGKDIHFQTADGKEAHGWEVMSAKPSDYYIFVIHEYWGLNDYIKQETEKLSQELGVNAIALDMYDNQLATTPEEAGKLMQAVNRDRAVNIITGAFSRVGTKVKVFTIGWCFGGGWSLQSSLIGGRQSAGCVMYYGQPEKSVDRLKTLNTDVLGIFANQDMWITPQVVDEFAANMQKAGKTLILKKYDAPHAFANPSNPKYNKEASEDAYKNVLKFLKERIK
jgi:carboxymethylenebutenolidase